MGDTTNYLIIVLINDSYELEKILELTWENFFRFKKWHSTMKAFNVSVTREILVNSKIIYNGKNNL